MLKEIIITVDIGASKIRVQPVSKDGDLGQIISINLIGQNLNNDSFVDLIAKSIDQAIDSLDDTKILAISIGSPGPLDSFRGVIKDTPNLIGVKDLNIVDRLNKKFRGLPIYLLNDADAAGLGEWWLGSGKDAKFFVYITLSTGVGSAFLVNGELQCGLGKAPEWGHTMLAIENKFPLCACGRRSCAEAFLGTDGLAKLYAKEFDIKEADLTINDKHSVSFKMREGVRNNDPKWQKIQEEYVKYLAVFLRNIILVHQPNAITLGGGIAFGNNELLKLTKDELKKLMDLTKDKMGVMLDNVWLNLAKFENSVNLGVAKYAFQKLRG